MSHALLGLLLCLSNGAWSQCLQQPPAGFPSPDRAFQTGLPEPADSTDATKQRQIAQSRLRLGQRLFGDSRLSISGRHSCASCHQPERAFSEAQARSRGALGDLLPHNAPTLLNVALKYQFNWKSDGPDRLVDQLKGPLHNQSPVELGFEPAFLQRLDQDPTLQQLLRATELPQEYAAEPGEPGFTTAAIRALLAYYVTSLGCATAFDRYLLLGERNALEQTARAGMKLFTSPALGCSDCHRGPLLGGGLRTTKQQFPATVVERDRAGRGVRLQTPSLRLVSQTAPYLFDGSAATLDEVLTQYERGAAGLAPFALTIDQRQALLAFLRTL